MNAHPSDPALTTLLSALTRLEATIDAETVALNAPSIVDLQEINRRKSRSLLELTRAARSLPSMIDPAVSQRVAQLKGKLALNQQQIAVRLGAAQEVAAILDRMMREGESDGTYSAGFVAGEARR